jgi:hypothetical protein
MAYDPDARAIEQERQQWVYEKIQSCNDLTRLSVRDPGQEYARHRANYVDSGSAAELELMLEYVQ